MTTLLLIRHATNDWVKKGLLAGWTPGVHLNQQGQAQAQALSQRLASIELEAVYSSPLERALETAQTVAQPHNLQVKICQDIGEVQYGEWNGQPLKQLIKQPLWKIVQTWPSLARFPGGESFSEMQTRVVTALEAIRTAHPQAIVAAVAHADVIKAAVAYYVGMPLDLFPRLVISPASLSIIEFTFMGPRLYRLNDNGELEFEPPTKRQRRKRARKTSKLLGPFKHKTRNK